jgi:type IV pilus assembly protein PilX
MLVITIIGLTALQGTTMQTRMATAMRDRSLAFEAAEAALRDAEGWLDARLTAGTKPDATSDGSTGVWIAKAPQTAAGQEDFMDWTIDNWTRVGQAYPLQNGAEIRGLDRDRQPRVVIEEWQFVSDTLSGPRGRQYYRITTNAPGATPETSVTLQALVQRRVP